MIRTLTVSLTLCTLMACGGPEEATDPAPAPRDNEGEQPAPEPTDDTSDCVPSAEVCDGADNDCDGAIDEEPTDGATFFADADGDGFGDPRATVVACVLPTGFADNDGDCDDALADVNPDQVDVCDGVDNDCDPSTGNVTLFTASGARDMTGALAGTPEEPALLVLDQEADAGMLAICAGTHFARLEIHANVSVEGVAGSDLTTLDAGRAGTVVTYGPDAGEVRLQGLTLQNGLGDENAECQPGGICVVSGVTLTGDDLVVQNNVSPGSGGGLAMRGGVATFTNTDLVGNEASTGGAIHVRPNGRLTMVDGSLRSNLAVNGGALFMLGGGSRATLERVDIDDNEATRNGGGLLIDNGRLTLIDAGVRNNTAEGNGGGIGLVGVASPAVIEDVVLEGNTAGRGAALFATRSGTLRNSEIFDNEATNEASAAVEVAGGTLTIEGVGFEDPLTGTGNAPTDLRAGDQRLDLGLDFSDTCDATGCVSAAQL